MFKSILGDAEEMESFVRVFQGVLDVVEVLLDAQVLETYLFFTLAFRTVDIQVQMLLDNLSLEVLDSMGELLSSLVASRDLVSLINVDLVVAHVTR